MESGQTQIVVTAGRQLIMRSIDATEFEYYKERFVAAYYLNWRQNTNSVMARLHGLFTFDNAGLGTMNDLQFILMESFLPFNLDQLHGLQQFDIKGDPKRLKVSVSCDFAANTAFGSSIN